MDRLLIILLLGTACTLAATSSAVASGAGEETLSYRNIVSKSDCSGQLQTGGGSRIVNGKDAPIGAFPYQVSLRKNDKHTCGGSILNERWILTAAHCLQNLNDDDMLVVVGTNKVSGEGGSAYRSVKIVFHADYNPTGVKNDVGMVKVNETIAFNERTSPVQLPTSDMDEDDHPAVVSGWGRLKANGELPQNLQYIPTCLLDLKKCAKKVPLVSKQNICSFTRMGQGNCNGDSGGPLVADGVQVGIVSYVIFTCAFGFPDVYTRVWAHLDWINEQIANY